MSLYQCIAGVADDGFGQGGAAPPTHASLTPSAKRHVMAARLGFSTGKGKYRRQRVRKGNGGGGQESVVPQAAKPPQQKMAREGFWKQVGSSFSS